MKALSVVVFATAMALAHSVAAQVAFHYHPPMAEIQGSGWALRYRLNDQPLFQLAGQDRAFFAHGRNLRWIDTRQGIVLNRWLLPEEIVHLTPVGANDIQAKASSRFDAQVVQVEMQSRWYGKPEVHRFILDPQNPQMPWFPPSPWGTGGSALEAAAEIPAYGSSLTEILRRLTADQARAAIPRVMEMARRDSLSPWFHVFIGMLLRKTGDHPSESNALEPDSADAEFQAAATPRSSSDFFEMFAIAAFLQEQGEAAASEAAFQIGLRDYRARGLDPRLFLDVSPRWSLYPVNLSTLPRKQIGLAQERVYQLGPWSSGFKLMLPLFAADAAKHGRTAEARLWQQRADEARAHSLSILEPMTTLWLDRPLRWALAAIMAAILYAVALFTKYYSRGRDDITLRRSQEGPGGDFRFLRVEYWSWTERVNFLLIVAVGWAALGIGGAHYRAWRHFEEIRPQSRYGTFAGPEFAQLIEQNLRPTPERELLLEINRRQSTPDGRPLVVPDAAQMERAFLGGGPERFPLWALAGPISASSFLGDYAYESRGLTKLLPVWYAVLLPLALATFLMPQWPPLASPPGTRPSVWPIWRWTREALVPGVCSRWSFLGGLLLVAWCQELVRVFFVLAWGSLAIYSFTFRPEWDSYWRGTFGYNGDLPRAPDGLPLYGAVAAIWLVNLLLVSVLRRRGT